MFKSQCDEYIVVEFNGDAYPCDFFVGREWKLGNIFEVSMEELFDKAKLQFGNLKRIIPLDCKSCRWNFICHNGCLWFRWVKSGSVRKKDYLCASYKQFFPYTAERFKRLRDTILLKQLILRLNIDRGVSYQDLLKVQKNLSQKGVNIRVFSQPKARVPLGAEVFYPKNTVEGKIEIDYFIDAILEKDKEPSSWRGFGPVPSGYDGLESVRIVNAIEESARERRAVKIAKSLQG